MGNNLCVDRKEHQTIDLEIRTTKDETNFRVRAREPEAEEVSPGEMKAKAQMKPRKKDLRQDLLENLSLFGVELELGALRDMKSRKVLEIQTNDPLSYEEDMAKELKLKKNRVVLNPIRLFNGNVYEGEWSRKQNPEGQGEMLKTDGTLLEGMWKNGLIVWGRIFYISGAYYEGLISNDVPNGMGALFEEEATYAGQWENGLLHGQGTVTYKDNSKLAGIFQFGRPSSGMMIWKEIGMYQGSFNNYMLHGNGRFTTNTGDSYAGDWKLNYMDGFGTYTWSSHMHSYTGDYKKGKKEGRGTYYFEDPDVYYKGQWHNDRPHGRGDYVTREKTFSGIWRYGKLIDGEGIDLVFYKENINSRFLPHVKRSDDSIEKKPVSPSYKYKPVNVEKDVFVLKVEEPKKESNVNVVTYKEYSTKEEVKDGIVINEEVKEEITVKGGANEEEIVIKKEVVVKEEEEVVREGKEKERKNSHSDDEAKKPNKPFENKLALNVNIGADIGLGLNIAVKNDFIITRPIEANYPAETPNGITA